MVISQYSSEITLEFLKTKRENQYFERKGLGDKDAKPTRIADELIGMLNADGGVLAWCIAAGRVLPQYSPHQPARYWLESTHFAPSWVHAHLNSINT